LAFQDWFLKIKGGMEAKKPSSGRYRLYSFTEPFLVKPTYLVLPNFYQLRVTLFFQRETSAVNTFLPF